MSRFLPCSLLPFDCVLVCCWTLDRVALEEAEAGVDDP